MASPHATHMYINTTVSEVSMWLSLSKDQVLQLLLTATSVEFFSLLTIDIPSLLLLVGSRECQVHSFPHVATKWVMRWYLLHP